MAQRVKATRSVSVSRFQQMMDAERAADGLGERMAERAESTVSAMGRAQVVDVGPDGIVEAVRPAEMTPDRGEGVGTTVRTVGEDDGQRFSGGGADDVDHASALIPNDADFKGKAYLDAPGLANIAERLIHEHGFLEDLVNCEIRWYWKRKTGVSKGRVKIGFMKRASDLLGHFAGCDFIGWLSATTARDGRFSDRQVEAAVFHQLCHIGEDDNGNWIKVGHDFEGFASEVRVYGTWTEDLKLGGQAFTAAHQMGLFDADDEDDGRSVWDDVRDDLEAEELQEQRPRDPFMGEPDTSGELPTDDEIDAARARADDDEDILADPAVI